MTDAHVIFKAVKVSEGDWQLVCHCPEGKIEYVTGFLDESRPKIGLQASIATIGSGREATNGETPPQTPSVS